MPHFLSVHCKILDWSLNPFSSLLLHWGTWKSTCTYSTFLANKSPTCCVSLSTFYNPEVTPCNLCSCGCKLADHEAKSCIGLVTKQNSLLIGWNTSILLIVQRLLIYCGLYTWNRQSSSSPYERELLQCTDHMCPLRVHWHIKKNYRNYWRVKLTVSNYNLGKNYSNWNVVVQHPGFSQQATVFSFNNTMLPTVGVPGICSTLKSHYSTWTLSTMAVKSKIIFHINVTEPLQ